MVDFPQTIRIDIFGGERSMDHVARFHEQRAVAVWERVARELAAGFLVNVRMLAPGEGWGPNEDFDERAPLTIGRA